MQAAILIAVVTLPVIAWEGGKAAYRQPWPHPIRLAAIIALAFALRLVLESVLAGVGG